MTQAWPSYNVVNVLLDQKAENGTQTIGTMNRWNGAFVPVSNLPASLQFSVGSTQFLRADQSMVSGQKYINWTRSTVLENDVKNHHDFPITSSDNSLISHLKTTNNATLRCVLVDDGSIVATPRFKDPWLIDTTDPNRGNSPINQGFSAQFKTVEYGLNNVGISSIYAGVFLNQNVQFNPSLPIYSVQADASISIGSFTGYFQTWVGTPVGVASFQNGAAATTSVVFNSGGGTISASYKAHLGSGISSATGVTSQRKMIYAYTSGYWTYHAVYQSGGEIWYTKSTDNGQTWSPEMMLSRGSGTAHNPSIAEVSGWGTYGYVVWVDVTDRQGASGYDINVKKFNVSTGVWSNTENTSDPENPAGAGFATQNAHPVAVSFRQGYQNSPEVIVAYESSESGIRYSYFAYSEYLGYTGWITNTVQYSSGKVNPSLTIFATALKLTMNDGTTAYLSDGQIILDSYTPHPVFNTPIAVATGSFSDAGNSVVDRDGSGRTLITWTAFDDYYWGRVVMCRSKDYNGNWSPLTEIFDDLSEYPVLNTSISADDIASGATLLWSDGYTYFNQVTTDGVNWYTNNLTPLPNSNFPNTIAKSGAYVHALYTQNTSAPYRVQYRTWDNSNWLPKGTVQGSPDALMPIEITYRRMELFNPEDSSHLAVQFGNLSVKDATVSTPISFEKVNAMDIKAAEGSFLETSTFALSTTQDILADISVRSKDWKLKGAARLQLIDAQTGDLLANLGTFDCCAANGQIVGSPTPYSVSTNSPGKQVRLRCLIDQIDQSKLRVDYVTVIRVSLNSLPSKEQARTNRITAKLPKDFGLSQNYPNPFNPTTAITYQIPTTSMVKLEVYDIAGRRVADLVSGIVEAGYHTLSFDASHLSSGTYVYRLEAISSGEGGKRFTDSKKMVLLK